MADLNTLLPIASIDAPASMDNWEQFNGFVQQQAEAQLGAGKAAYQLRLACEELLSNIIRHSTCSDSVPSCAHLWVQVLKTTEPKPLLVVQLEDNGHPFDPQFDQRQAIDTSKAIEDRPIGGLGLFLVQQSVDRAEYALVDGRNRYRLFVNLSSSEGAAE
jgi:serine/threonine-protein kinase RsbW